MSEGHYFEAICSGLSVFGGTTSILGKLGSAGKLSKAGCVVFQITKTMSCVGAIGIGGYDIYQIYQKNYEKYVVNGEDFSLKEAAFDAVRITFDAVAIGVGIKGLQADIKYCFVAGTLITMANGQKVIEEVRVGDEVLAMEYETGEVAVKKVSQTFVNETDEIQMILII